MCYLRGTAEDSTVSGFVRFTTGKVRYFLLYLSHLTPIFAQVEGETQVEVEISGITKNVGQPHGLHIHVFGDLSDSEGGLSTGGHFVGSSVVALVAGVAHI